jgi:hypothetical protein
MTASSTIWPMALRAYVDVFLMISPEAVTRLVKLWRDTLPVWTLMIPRLL